MEAYLTASPLPGMLLWIVLYISDYYLTLRSAKGYRDIGHFQFEKSFELTPQYQSDIDNQVRVSKRHIAYLITFTLVILVLWLVFVALFAMQGLYSLYLGLFLLLEVAVHFRHVRNLYLIHILKKEGGVDGQVTYRQRFSYRISAFDLYLFSILYLMAFFVNFSFFFLGGAVACAATGFRHSRYAAKIQISNTTEQHADPS